MSSGRLGALVAVAATAAMLSTAQGAPASDEILASLSPGAASAVRMSAYAGHVVWSEAVAPGRYVLMRWHAGRVDRLPVAPRAVPFDVDLGPDARGRPVAVYSRCPGERETAVLVGGCDVYRLALQGGRERRIRRASTATSSEYAPAIWRGNLAFASSKTAAGPAAVMLLRRGARRSIALRRQARGAGGRVWDVDLTSNAVIFQWPAGDGGELRRVPLSGRRGRVLARSFTQEGNAVATQSPNAAPKETLWVRHSSTPCLETSIMSDRNGRRRSTAAMPRDILALARDGTSLYAMTSAPAPCSVPQDLTLVRLGPPAFRAGG
jgi:hypothetical protein